MTRRTAPRLLAAAAVALSLAACGGTDAASPQAAGSTTAAASDCLAETPTTEAPAEVSTDLAEEPAAPCYSAAAPTELVLSDVVVGTGAEAVAGTDTAVKYVGAFYESGEEFDASWKRGDDYTLPVTVGAGRVIPGFDQGIEGMKVGGRRMVTIPSDLGYGPQGQGPIPGGATLVFIIDLVSVG
ncbi:FKBP-type peptidyl-prolyl cis-trans isomerase [Modestobacter sp. SSW1-42]|uniref:FKBP-type peptidyl-prolyl cis-trans isomerase n=1 Tax=Modestobacter sp. SSW1-42 TaxID=596372 RepID=UPI0039889D4E